VGGYCLTKDPLFALASLGSLFNIDGPEFVFSKLAMEVNQKMPLHAVRRLSSLMNNELEKKNILVMGVSYKGDIGDSRFSPSELLVRTLKARGAHVMCFDPFLSYWSEMEQPLLSDFPDTDEYEAVVFATAHSQFYDLDVSSWLKGNRPVVLDAVNIMSESQRRLCRESGVVVETIGRGSGL
jgi:UDP-N-acetyl-D-mannosaminuronate dehydrogenase